MITCAVLSLLLVSVPSPGMLLSALVDVAAVDL